MDILETSRAEQEAQIIRKWISRLATVLEDAHLGQFELLLREVGVQGNLTENNFRATKEQFDTLMRRLRRIQQNIYFKFYEAMDLLDLGLVGYAAISSGSVRNAINVLMNYQDVTTSSFYFRSEENANGMTISVFPYGPFMQHNDLIVEDALAGLWHFLDSLIQGKEEKYDCRVNFNFRSPHNFSAYDEYFGPIVNFDMPNAELRVPTKTLAMEISTANPDMSGLCLSICDRIFGRLQSRSDITRLVQQLILARPGARMLRLDEAANQLNMSVSQFRKKIYATGTSYKQIVLQTRMSLAQHYLSSTGLTIQEISYLLDYKNPGAFSRAYKNFFGKNPIDMKLDKQAS